MPNPHLEEATELIRKLHDSWMFSDYHNQTWSLRLDLTGMAVRVDTVGVRPEEVEALFTRVRPLAEAFKYDPLTSLRMNQLMRQLERAKETL